MRLEDMEVGMVFDVYGDLDMVDAISSGDVIKVIEKEWLDNEEVDVVVESRKGVRNHFRGEGCKEMNDLIMYNRWE